MINNTGEPRQDATKNLKKLCENLANCKSLQNFSKSSDVPIKRIDDNFPSSSKTHYKLFKSIFNMPFKQHLKQKLA